MSAVSADRWSSASSTAAPTGSSTTEGVTPFATAMLAARSSSQVDSMPALSARRSASASSRARSASATEMRSAVMTPARNGSTSRPSTDTRLCCTDRAMPARSSASRCRAARFASRCQASVCVDDRVGVRRRPRPSWRAPARRSPRSAPPTGAHDGRVRRRRRPRGSTAPPTRAAREHERHPGAVRRDREDQHADHERARSRRRGSGSRRSSRRTRRSPRPPSSATTSHSRSAVNGARAGAAEMAAARPGQRDEHDREHGGERRAHLAPVREGQRDRRDEREDRADRDDRRRR